MAPRIEIVGDQVISTPERLLDFVAVVSWKKGEVHLDSMCVGKEKLSARNLFYMWVGITGLLLEQQLPPKIQKILVTSLQALNPEFTYQAKIEREK